MDWLAIAATGAGFVAVLYALLVRVATLERLTEHEKAFLDEWRGHAGAELDGLLQLAKNHEARIAELENRP